ncbi:MAG: metal ABC transporter solute-binding protein, Zn/Mn family [Oscillochloridaceae bacterium umkhey_bin13]
MKNKTLPLLILAMLLLLGGCGAAQPTSNDPTNPQPLTVVVTTQHLADAVQAVAADKVTLRPLLAPGVDPHTYVPTQGDLQLLRSADLILYNGLHLEAQMLRVFEQIASRDEAMVVAVAEQINPEQLLSWEPEAGMPYDPHIWHDASLWSEAVGVIATTLSSKDPANAATYNANAARYQAELAELHTAILEQVARIPTERRMLVTAHDAFSYYGRAYGLNVEAIQGVSTASEASAADIQALTALILERQVPAIFVESTVSPRTIEAVVAAVQAAGQELRIGGELFADALGAPGTPEGSYLGMMRHNLTTIVTALAEGV